MERLDYRWFHARTRDEPVGHDRTGTARRKSRSSVSEARSTSRTGKRSRRAILDSVTLETRCVVLDLSGVRYFDSVGVRLSFDVEQRLSRHGIAFGIVRPARSYVRKVLELCGAEHVLATFDDRDAALDGR